MEYICGCVLLLSHVSDHVMARQYLGQDTLDENMIGLTLSDEIMHHFTLS